MLLQQTRPALIPTLEHVQDITAAADRLVRFLSGLGLLEPGRGTPRSTPAKAPSGGTSLEELRRQHGQQAKPLMADLETLARAKREQIEKQATAKKEEEARQKAALQREKDRVESERRRLEAFDSPTDPPVFEPLGREESLPTTPPTPELPPPEPFAAEPPASAPSGAPAAGAPSQP
jgi:hypothetical protein